MAENETEAADEIQWKRRLTESQQTMRRNIDKVLDFAEQVAWRDVPETTRDHVKSLILDSFTVLTAGYRAVGCREVLDVLAQWPAERGSSVLLGALKLPTPTAAMANAMLAEAWDFDDVHDAAIVHCMSPVLYSALATAEGSRKDVDGNAFLGAVAVGLEVLARLGMACTSPLTWTRTATLGGLGGALAATRVLEGNRDRLINAAGIAYMQSAGNSQTIVDSATAKKLQVGFAARGAALASLLAERGLTGPRDILEGRYGYYELYEHGQHHLDSALESLGHTWEIDKITVKPFACARETHAAVFAAFDATRGRRLPLSDIDRVVMTGPRILRDISGKGPIGAGAAAVVSAHLSIPYTVAVVLLEGDLMLDDFTQTKVLEPLRQGLSERVEVRVDDSLPSNDLAPANIAVHLCDGTILRGSCHELPIGIDSTQDATVMEGKRRSCLAMANNERASEALSTVSRLLGNAEAQPDFASAVIEAMA